MKKRLITKTSKVKFKPFDNYGKVFKGMDWYKITYDPKKGQGSYILKLEIEDNDGEIVVHDLQIIVEAKEQTDKAYTFEVIFVIFVIFLVGVVRFVRSKNRKIKTIDLPKWNENN